MVTMTLNIEVELDDVFFDDLICAIFEGGSNYWIDYVDIKHPSKMDKPKGTPASTWIADALNKGGSVIVFVSESDEKITLVKNMLIEGIEKWAKNFPTHVYISHENTGHSTIDNGNIDAEQADIIMQYALFNDVIFG